MKIILHGLEVELEGLSKVGAFYYCESRDVWCHSTFRTIHDFGKSVDGAELDIPKLVDYIKNELYE